MVFACQNDSYARKLPATVVSCSPAEGQVILEGKKTKVKGYEVILDDTILFPEGGGQPDDRGTIGSSEVLRVTRRGAEAVHFVRDPLTPGDVVEVTVDWCRRWHHMQQHSGQHLITAILDQLYGFQTTSWALRDTVSFIEIDAAELSRDQLEAAERRANELIREARPVRVTVHQPGDPQLAGVRARGLPDDHTGAVRIVSMEGIDDNMCCGTHVSSLAHLQAVKLLQAERGKKGRTNVHFVAGQRLLDHLGETAGREAHLNTVLRCGPAEHGTILDKWQRSLKTSQRACRQLLRQLAQAEVTRFRSAAPPLGFLSVHQPAGDAEFMATVVSLLDDETVLAVVTVGGEDGGAGSLLVRGPAELVSRVAPKLCQLMDGKGAGKNGRFTARLASLKRRPEADDVIRQEITSVES
ncbi:alanyl-tRNA editing protein Aarsd1-like isoform X1 [Pollicipes pollicipes]|uniref:alanyl-tRNA editing protein Aarsd1-like isoform X1 n=1 Tax=Pollicipes pollicipes TaxID=41117 RepID=UPI001885A34B|nr:alanyl-tRNA editing protein Aarsd1-like isoform X1 [Pollicipes pollicipes]